MEWNKKFLMAKGAGDVAGALPQRLRKREEELRESVS